MSVVADPGRHDRRRCDLRAFNGNVERFGPISLDRQGNGRSGRPPDHAHIGVVFFSQLHPVDGRNDIVRQESGRFSRRTRHRRDYADTPIGIIDPDADSFVFTRHRFSERRVLDRFEINGVVVLHLLHHAADRRVDQRIGPRGRSRIDF